MDKIVQLPLKQRSELFSETAARKGVTNAIAEKDFWVTWVLSKIFSDPHLSSIMIFKGGTSLSKVFGLIERFSEDIDLILDWRTLTNMDPREERSKSAQDKFNKEINEKALIYISNELLPIVSEMLKPYAKCTIDTENPFSINVRYPSAFSDAYLRPEILLEIGPLASWLPFDHYEVKSFAADEFPQLFKQPSCKVRAIVAERTFWEKATILHQEAHRPLDRAMLSRYSRHYYDLAMMAQSDVKAKALANTTLLKDVVAFKQQFYPSRWAKYEDAQVGTFKLIPPIERFRELQRDYDAMRSMIFVGHYPPLDEIMEILKSLEGEINR